MVLLPRTRSLLPAPLLALLLALPACAQRPAARPTEGEPLGELIAALSEPGGYFDTDNLISNEGSYTQGVERLRPMGGVYVGVGPEQNFHYIARLRPSWAFVLDVRRDNMLHHLLLNGILEQAETPYEYLCWLFSRPISPELRTDAVGSMAELARRVEKAPPDEGLFERRLEILLEHIRHRLGVELSDEDRQAVRGTLRRFFEGQLELRFRSHGRPPMAHHPSYRSLLVAETSTGESGHFLGSVESYRVVRDLARAGRLVPVVGDFAGEGALRAIGDFVRRRGEEVTAFYTSNVEYYLLRSGRYPLFVENLKQLPRSDEALLIRSYFDYGQRHPLGLSGERSTVLLQEMSSFLRLFDEGAYRSYWDVCTLDYVR